MYLHTEEEVGMSSKYGRLFIFYIENLTYSKYFLSKLIVSKEQGVYSVTSKFIDNTDFFLVVKMTITKQNVVMFSKLVRNQH